MRTEVESTHHTFVLRIWRETAVADWRFTLQSTQPEQKRHFVCPQTLFSHIEQILAEQEANHTSPHGDKPHD